VGGRESTRLDSPCKAILVTIQVWFFRLSFTTFTSFLVYFSRFFLLPFITIH
jgi:hypothetical protein